MSLASIPSPHSGTIDLGPLTIHMYGLMLLLAIAACIWLTGVRWVRRGGDWDLVLNVAVWGVAAGIVGARAYHDITSWNEVPSPKWKGIFAVWEGGLGVWGGILLGCLVGAYIVHRAGAPRARLHGRGRAGPAARAGDRPLGQLVEPGALRQADAPALGPEDRLRAPRRRLREQRRPSTRPSSTSSSTTSPASGSCCCSTGASASSRRRCSRSTSRSTRPAASSRSCCGSTRRTTSPGCA